MVTKTKTREISLTGSHGAFSLLKKYSGYSGSKEDFNFSGIEDIRQLLSNERARILYIIKTQKPLSIYELAKKLNRNFRSVNQDIKLLQKLGFIGIIKEKTKNRTRYRPELLIDNLIINVKID